MHTVELLAAAYNATEDEILEVLDTARVYPETQRPNLGDVYGDDAIDILDFAFAGDLIEQEAEYEPGAPIYCCPMARLYTADEPRMLHAMHRLAARRPDDFRGPTPGGTRPTATETRQMRAVSWPHDALSTAGNWLKRSILGASADEQDPDDE